MATQSTTLGTAAAVNVTDGLTLTDGMNYSAQVQGGTVRIVELADAADLDLTDDAARATAEATAFRYPQGSTFTIRAVAGQEIFAWSEDTPARLVISTGYS